jgi:hypothetical protein
LGNAGGAAVSSTRPHVLVLRIALGGRDRLVRHAGCDVASVAVPPLSLPGVGSSFLTEAGIHSQEEREAQLVTQMGSGMEERPELNDTHASHSVINCPPKSQAKH